VNIAGIRAALGNAPANVAVGTTQLNCLPYTPTSVTVPCFYPGEAQLGYATERNTFNGIPVVEATCMLLAAPENEDQEGQALLDAYLSHPGSTSVKAAIEADQTLGGLCKLVFVHDVDGYRLYTVGTTAYYGARFRILVMGG
jgi:hypothetical protein